MTDDARSPTAATRAQQRVNQSHHPEPFHNTDFSQTSSKSDQHTTLSIYDAPKPLPVIDGVVFEYDDRPFTCTLPKLSPLPPLMNPSFSLVVAEDTKDEPKVVMPESHRMREEHEKNEKGEKQRKENKRNKRDIRKQRESARSDSVPRRSSWRAQEVLSVSDFDPVRGEKVSPCPSFAFGVLLGINPLFVVLRWCMHKVRDPSKSKYWDERWLKYGTTLGLFFLIVISIVIVVVNVR